MSQTANVDGEIIVNLIPDEYGKKNNQTMQLQTAELQQCCESHKGKVSNRHEQSTRQVFLSLTGDGFVFIAHS